MNASDPVQMLIDAGAIPASPYSEASRYRGVPLATLARADGTLLAYSKRRFIAPRSEIQIAAGHLVQGGERPDLQAHMAYQQALLYWRIADGNAVIDPFELSDTLGARIAIPVPPDVMSAGLQLGVYIGPVPIPAPAELVHAISKVKVDEGSGDAQSGFEITLDLPQRSPLRTIFLVSGGGGGVPLMRVTLTVTLNGRTEPLIDGMATNVETVPGEGGVSQIVVKGKDLSALMAIIELPGLPFPAMPPSLRVLMILAKYAALGVIPLVIPSIADVPPLPIQRIPVQRGNDLDYVKRLAADVGYVFYLEPGPAVGTSKAYWGPEIRVGEPQPALTTNMDAASNVESINFNFDRERKKMPIVFFQESASKVPIPILIPDITPLNPPLGLVPPLPPKIEQLADTAQLSAPEALMKGLAFAAQNSDSVFGNGRLDVMRYGRLLRSRKLVGVRGAGLPFDGLYYVKSVTHEIERGAYKQGFSLARNALISTFPTVPV